ncbi:MAG: sortase [Gaiellaceae bacterium MAG52_C11]|nr:sortase [Candidatus Gaiellasilicea maunaloa]
MRRTARVLGTLLIVAGLGTLAWAITVWQWQDPVTAVVNRVEQRELSQKLERSFDRVRPSVQGVAVSPAQRRRGLERDAGAWRKMSAEGDAIAKIRIPRLGLNAVVVNGTDSDTLKRGPGRYLGSAMPGQGELVYIAGHRTTYGAPFSRIDRLRKGDRVFLELPYGSFEYSVTGHRIVEADELSVLESEGREQLALQACHPRFFATHRYIAYAKPVGVTPPDRGGDDS